MADEQVIVDIQVDSKEVNQAEKSIDRLTDSIEELANRISTARKQNKTFKKEQQDLNKAYRDGKISSDKYEKEVDQLNKKIKVNNKVIAESSIELSKQKRERNANIKLINSESNSRDQLRQKISILTKEYNGLNIETKEGQIRSKQLQKELKKLNEEINEGSKSAGSFKDNIGNYPQILQDAAGGVEGLSDKFKALIANPVVLLLTLIVVSLKALFSAFKKSESGAKLLEKAGAALNGLMMILTKVMGALADALTKAFEDPQQAVKDLWEAIKKNLVNRIEGVIRLFKALSSIDFKDLTGSAKELGSALVQIGTGLDEQQQQAIVEGFEDMAIAAAILADKMIKLASAQRAMRAQSRTLEKEIAVLNAEFERLGEIAGDDTRNMEEMRQAAIDAGNAAAELAKKQEQLAQVRLSTINQEVAVRRSAGEDIQGLLDQQADAEVALTEARSKAAIAQQKILIEQRKIERDIFEQNLDILLDIGDKIKTAQEKAIANENLSLEKRKKLLEASRVALTANFGEIKKEYELYGITAEQINEVINTSDAKQTNEKLKNLGLNEIAINRLREIILERRQAELDFADISKKLSDEEIERKQTANDKIKEINDNAAVLEIEKEIEKNEKLIQAQSQKNAIFLVLSRELSGKLIEIEKERLKTLLEDETLLAEERIALEKKTQARIKEIKDELKKKEKEKEEEDKEEAKTEEEKEHEERKELIQEQFDELIDITEEFALTEIAIFGRIAQGIGAAFEEGKITAETALKGLSIAANGIFDAISVRRAQDLTENEVARKRELESAGSNEAAKAAINEKFDRKAADLKRKQFNADKAAAIINVAINTALGITQALASSPPPASFVLAALVGALGVAQGIIIASKKAPKFAAGVNDIVNIGGSHASGSDVDVFGFSGGKKQYFGKVEKGEAMPVIRKSAVNDYMIAKLNGRFSGKGRTFQDGTGDVTNQDAQTQNGGISIPDMIEAFSNVQIVAKIEDITKEAGKKIEIVDNSKV